MSNPIKYPFLLFILLFGLSHSLSGQEPLRIRGKVVDAKSGKIIPFVTVQIKDVPLGTITEEDGKFAVKIPVRYAQDSLVFSSVGYDRLHFAIADLKVGEENLFSLTQAVVQLADVTVTRGKKRLRPMKVLKEAIAKIPENYPGSPQTFDAYYRERIIENGATIKYSDASVTFQQVGYSGEAPRRRRSSMSPFVISDNRQGIRLGTYSGMSGIHPAGERLHDHFGLRSERNDRVKIHDSRASMNLTREKMTADIEGGPLSTLSKDLVRNLDLFMHRKRFKKYRYTVTEEPDDTGKWFYVVHFKPKKQPATLEWVRERRAKYKLISRLNILSGEVWVEPESLAIAKMSYSVQNDYRRHICNLQENEIKHYGYEVEVNYQQVGDHWQIKDLTRKDEFIFKDTITEKTTPYATITELFVTNPQSELTEVPPRENFLNIITNTLYDYPLEYNPEFWAAYEVEVPEARPSAQLRKDMEEKDSLEVQFAQKHIRNDSMKPPVAPIIATTQRVFGEELKDDYQWLKDTKNPRRNEEVMDYLMKENDYADNYFIPMRKLERDLINKLYKTIDLEAKTDSVKRYGYWYWSKYEPDNDYRTIYRRKDEPGAKAEVVWDLQAMAEDKNYFSLNFFQISPDDQYMAFAIDTVGGKIPPTYIKDMRTGEMVSDTISNLRSLVWAEDSRGFFYSVVDPKVMHSKEIKFHILGQPVASDTTYFSSSDPAVNLGISKSQSKKFLYMYRNGSNSNEMYLARNKAPYIFEKVRDAEPDVSYSFNHVNDQFYIMTNLEAPNYRLLKADTANWNFDQWREVIPASDSVILVNYDVFDNHLVALKKEKMKQRIEITNLSTNYSIVLDARKSGPVYTMGLGNNRDPSSDTLRYTTSSPTYKTWKVAYNLKTGKSKRKLVSRELNIEDWLLLGGIRSRLVWADARDGTKIPISIIQAGRRSGYIGNRPVLVEGYGAYGISTNIGYEPSLLVLLERGFVYAHVHVRGGGDLGEEWYEQGKMENKMNSFTDMIDAVEYMKRRGLGNRRKFFGSGGSAGGLLMGAVVNMRPDLFEGVFLDVPFVDVMNTMMDESLPLTKGEYQEWGNPNKRKDFKRMLSYSPYDNVKPQEYPRMAFYAGLNDRNVGYWEAAKMVARLRATKTDDNVLLLRTGFYAGHGPSSGRFAGLSYAANKYAILLEWLNEVNQELWAEKTK